jgi:hypothetical protein
MHKAVSIKYPINPVEIPQDGDIALFFCEYTIASKTPDILHFDWRAYLLPDQEKISQVEPAERGSQFRAKRLIGLSRQSEG